MKNRFWSDDAFVAEINTNLPRLRRLCAVYCRETNDRQDLLQDMIVAAWRARESFRGEAEFSTWLYRVAVNAALQRLRQRRRVPLTEPLADRHTVPSASPPPDAQNRQKLMAAIEKLQPIDRSILALSLDDKSHAEIGSIVGATSNAIGVRLSRIRERLRTIATTGECRGD